MDGATIVGSWREVEELRAAIWALLLS
jgi:hypothetical protein